MRYALFLATGPNTMTLGEALMGLPLAVQPCPTCRALAGSDGCPYCKRSSPTLCIVHRYVDLLAVERAEPGLRFFVLGKLLSPLDGVDAQDLPMDELREAAAHASEVVLALPSSVSGDATALFLAHVLKGRDVSRLALGLPHGGDVEFADQVTVQRALRGRTKVTL
jgi:recombination protein RecR